MDDNRELMVSKDHCKELIMINQLSIIGLGVIGGSLARALRNTNFCKSIIGYDIDPETANSALNQKIIDCHKSDIISAVKSADLIVIAVPFNEYCQVFSQMRSHYKKTAIIIDVCNIKMPIIKLAEQTLRDDFTNFVPCHPITHSHKSGLAATNPALFANRPIAITPAKETNHKAIDLVQRLWQKAGAEIEFVDPKQHDAMVAATNHLPYILAFTVINCLYKDKKDVSLKYIGGGFKDFTGIFSSSPALWLDICLSNREAILNELENFQSHLQSFKKLLEGEDSKRLLENLSFANSICELIQTE
jgi:prephenate dehydrogenase